MVDVSKLAHREMSTKAKVINTAVILVVIFAVVALMGVCGVGAWVPFLVLVLWAIQGIKLDPKSVAQEFIGVAAGLFMGYLVRHSGELGNWALAVFFVMVILLFIGMVNHIGPLMWVFNNYTAAFCTVGTAMPYGTEIVADYVFSLVLFGLLPVIAVTLVDKLKGGKAEAA